MKKDAYYFAHDYNTTSDPKIQSFLSIYGGTGYGVFWRIIEMLHEESTHKLPLKKYIFNAIGFQLKCDPDIVLEMVQYLTDECEIFKTENEFFYSERVLSNMDKRDEISNKRSQAGKRSAELRQNNPTVVQQKSTGVEQKPTKETKGNENKGNEKIDFNGLLNYFNSNFEKNCRVFSDSVKSKFRSRIGDGYTTTEIAKAMQVCKNDQFHKDNNFKYCTIEYFSRAKTLDQYAFIDNKQNKKYTPTK